MELSDSFTRRRTGFIVKGRRVINRQQAGVLVGVLVYLLLVFCRGAGLLSGVPCVDVLVYCQNADKENSGIGVLWRRSWVKIPTKLLYQRWRPLLVEIGIQNDPIEDT